MAEYSSFVEAGAQGAPSAQDSGFLSPDASMVLLTWITFFLLLAILHKFAWKPILANLDAREERIRRSLEEADKVKEDLQRINQTRDQVLGEAEVRAKEILDQSRKAAAEAAKIIQHKAREEGQILLENARREIQEEKEKAQADLRQESAHIAIRLAGKLLEENLDNEKNRRLINEYIKEI